MLTRPSTRANGPPGQAAAQHGSDAGEQVGHSHEVAQDEVPVEADERQQLLEHLQGHDSIAVHDLSGDRIERRISGVRDQEPAVFGRCLLRVKH